MKPCASPSRSPGRGRRFRSLGDNAQFVQAVATQIGYSTNRYQQRVEGDAYVLASVFGDEDLLAVVDNELFGTMIDQDSDVFAAKTCHDQFRDLRVLADHDAWGHFDLCHRCAETGEGLRQLATNRAATENQQPAW